MVTFHALVHSLLWYRMETRLMGALVTAHSLRQALEWRLVVAVWAHQV